MLGERSVSVSAKRDLKCDARLPPPAPSSSSVWAEASPPSSSGSRSAASSTYSEGGDMSGHHFARSEYIRMIFSV
jgi:hypothetical protein